MSKTLFFNVPFYKKNKIEKKVINDLGCPCYKIVGNTKYYSDNKDYWVVLSPGLLMVCVHSEDKILETKNIFYNK